MDTVLDRADAQCKGGQIGSNCTDFFFYSLVCITVWGGGEVDLHDHLEFGLVAAVFEGGVVVVAAEHVGLVVWEARTVKAEVVTPLVVGVGFTHSVMSWEGCSFGEDKNLDVTFTQKLLVWKYFGTAGNKNTNTQLRSGSWPLMQSLCFSPCSEKWQPLIRIIDRKQLSSKHLSTCSSHTTKQSTQCFLFSLEASEKMWVEKVHVVIIME